MKIISWNVNGLRAVERKGALQELIKDETPDILLLQEIKGKKEQFSRYLTRHPDYQQFYHSAIKPGYAGTGIWVRHDFLQKTRRIKFDMHLSNIEYAYSEEDKFHYEPTSEINMDLSRIPNMDEGRLAHVSFMYEGKIYDMMSIYFPNGGKSREAWENKLVFYDEILNYMNKLKSLGHEVIVGGDMNVAHNEIDLARPKENNGKIGFHPRERSWMDNVTNTGWVDVWRYKNPNIEGVYSWWDLKTRARERNVGWRIDYFFVHKDLIDDVADIKYLDMYMGSDHCPILMEIN